MNQFRYFKRPMLHRNGTRFLYYRQNITTHKVDMMLPNGKVWAACPAVNDDWLKRHPERFTEVHSDEVAREFGNQAVTL